MSVSSKLRVSVLCSSKDHPAYEAVRHWGRYSELKTNAKDLNGGDILFLVSCNELVASATRDKYKKTLVLHASQLPRGRGWSPHIWQIIEGHNVIHLSLLEAEDSIDSGNIWAQKKLTLDGTELSHEINAKLFKAEIDLMDYAIDNFDSVTPYSQVGEPSYYRKRTPADSEIDPEKTISEQFDLMRVADSARYPSWFSHRGKKYKLTLERYE